MLVACLDRATALHLPTQAEANVIIATVRHHVGSAPAVWSEPHRDGFIVAVAAPNCLQYWIAREDDEVTA